MGALEDGGTRGVLGWRWCKGAGQGGLGQVQRPRKPPRTAATGDQERDLESNSSRNSFDRWGSTPWSWTRCTSGRVGWTRDPTHLRTYTSTAWTRSWGSSSSRSGRTQTSSPHVHAEGVGNVVLPPPRSRETSLRSSPRCRDAQDP